ncbi:MAG: hypothetical protein ACOYL6_17975 [Bacteriovoracaceae bacterium]
MKVIVEEIKFQLKQDHDYYHHSLLNQSLHFLSGILNLVAICLIVMGSLDKGVALFMFSWLMRQLGHFFLESKDFDYKLNKTFQQKEDEKVGANLERKRMMIAGLILATLGFVFNPDLLIKLANSLGHSTQDAFAALMFFCLIVFVAMWVLRTLWLIVFHSPLRGISWFLKIMYDPINDIYLYGKSPLKLMQSLKGEKASV